MTWEGYDYPSPTTPTKYIALSSFYNANSQVCSVSQVAPQEGDHLGAATSILALCAVDNGSIRGRIKAHFKAQRVPQLPELEEVAAANIVFLALHAVAVHCQLLRRQHRVCGRAVGVVGALGVVGCSGSAVCSTTAIPSATSVS